MAETIRLATRGSDLALRQAASVAQRLETSRRAVELVEVETRGDQLRDELITRLGKTGAFVRSVDERVLAGEADVAVHSLKDVPTEFPDELVVAGVPRREPAGDVLLTPGGTPLADLPDGATVGTSSLRRRAQLLAERPGLRVDPLRGNVDTRVEKLLAPSLQREHERRLEAEEGEAGAGDEDAGDAGGDDAPAFDQSVEAWFDGLAEVERRALERDAGEEFDAIVLAEAGLDRVGLLDHVAHERLSPSAFVPAPGQGALAVTARGGSDVAGAVRDAVDHPRSRVEVTVERTVLAELGGGCVAPVGIHAVVEGAHVATTVRVLDREGRQEVRESRDLPVEDHAERARAFAADLAEAGAADLIERARRREDEREAKRG